MRLFRHKTVLYGERRLSPFLLLYFLICAFLLLQAAGAPRRIEITAHRGYSAQYPENTLAAFRGAIALGADCIELDVRQTADGVPVVLHDASLLRTTGWDRDIGDVTYAEIRKLDDGSWYSSQFSGERIPTLEEVLRLAKHGGVELNVELKPEGNGTLARTVADLLRQYGMRGRCVVTSANYELLKEIKRCDSRIKTGYITSIIPTHATGMKDADAFSVRAAFLSAAGVRRLHAADKQVFAWTVNTGDAMRNMIAFGVDDLITDNPRLAMTEVSSASESGLSQAFASVFFPS